MVVWVFTTFRFLSLCFITIPGTTGNQAPQLFNCPQDITRILPSTSNQVSVFWTAPTATDDFDTPTVTSSIQPGSSFQMGSTQVTYTARDSAGLSTTCSFAVIVIGMMVNV